MMLFSVTLSFLENSDWTAAREILMQNCNQPHWSVNDGEAGRCEYWLNYAQHRLKLDSTQGYRSLLVRYPFSWYGELANQRLKLDQRSRDSLLNKCPKAPCGYFESGGEDFRELHRTEKNES